MPYHFFHPSSIRWLCSRSSNSLGGLWIRAAVYGHSPLIGSAEVLLTFRAWLGGCFLLRRHLHCPQSLLKHGVLSEFGMGKSSKLLAPLSSSAGAFLRLAVLPVARIFHTIEGPTRRRVRAPGLQVTNGRCCRPGALTRRSGREIFGLASDGAHDRA